LAVLAFRDLKTGRRPAVFKKGQHAMATWIYQDDKQLKKHGADVASWYVGWIDPAGKKRCKSCGPGREGKRRAEKLATKTDAELITGTYQDKTNATWQVFRKEYETQVMAGMEAPTREAMKHCLDHFQRILKPVRMRGITSLALASYVAKRRQEHVAGRDRPVSPATVNKELRHVRAALRKAARWNYLAKVPEFDFLREPEKLPTYVTPEHFAKIYQACDVAKYPAGQPYPPADWWRALLMMGYLTGWRIGAILALRREDVDLDAGTAISRAADNKGKRDQLVPLHPVVVAHLRKLAALTPTFFPWPMHHRRLWFEFVRIQEEADVNLVGAKRHYGFHDLRRAFATMNADKPTADALQHLMQHRDYQTTKRYINIAHQLNPAVQSLYVPDVTLRKA